MSHLEKAYALDVKIRIEDEGLSSTGAAIDVQEFDNDGVVFEKDGLRVIGFEVDHGAVIKPACGYRIEYGGRSVVISGDTRYNENVVKYGAGADLLIHEVAIVRPELGSEPYIQRIMAHHTTAREAGTIFAPPSLGSLSFWPISRYRLRRSMTSSRRRVGLMPVPWKLGRT
jgi:ribonuclease Z